ncbi:hypothetical protein V7S43_018398 [Phytophthora oleae]|uniref:Uncharacterized protein n=1 Tax=Phytophthora oleae TaxID=2107226 RepID=A0ABD3EUN9_9STRA
MIPQAQRKRKLRARKPARLHNNGESAEEGSHVQLSEESTSGSPQQKRLCERAIDDDAEE